MANKIAEVLEGACFALIGVIFICGAFVANLFGWESEDE